MTEKSSNVTENDSSVTQESVTPSRARHSLRLLSRLSRVTQIHGNVTDGCDSDNHSLKGRDRHGQAESGNTSENFSAGCTGNCRQGRDCNCEPRRSTWSPVVNVALIMAIAGSAVLLRSCWVHA